MPQSYKEYSSGELSTKTYSVPFKYLIIDDVKVIGFDGEKWTPLALDATLPTDAINKTVTLADTPASSYTKIRLYRATSTTQLVDFQNGSRLSERDLDTAYQQGLFAAQEIAEDASTAQFTAVAAASLQAGTSLSNFAAQEFTGDGTTSVFSITEFTPQTTVAMAYRVSIDGVMQAALKINGAYTISISPSKITFASAPPSGSKIVVVTAASSASAVSVDGITIGLTSANKAEIRDLGVTNDKLAGSITQDKLAGGITNAKLAGGITQDKLSGLSITDSELAGSIATSKLAEVIDDDTFTTGVSATSLASSESIKAYINASRPKFVSLTGGTLALYRSNRPNNTIDVYNIADFTSTDPDFHTRKIVGLIVEAYTASTQNHNIVYASLGAAQTIDADGNLGSTAETTLSRTSATHSYDSVTDGASTTIPINAGQTAFSFRFNVNNTAHSTYNISLIRGAIIVPTL